jgi:aspartate racemase
MGVLGGMGPLATVDFLRKVVDATSAASDQDHIPFIVYSVPQIPDRTAAFFGWGPSPFSAMLKGVRTLETAGVESIAIPCNTAHLWHSQLQAQTPVEILHIVKATLEQVELQYGQPRLGLLATAATIESGLYQSHGQGKFDWVLPTEQELHEHVMPGIQAVKAGDLSLASDTLKRVAHHLFSRGAEVLVYGCTEVPIALQAESFPSIDPTLALAKQLVFRSTGCEFMV